MTDATTHPPLPPKWHGADYAAHRISDIANRPPGAVRQVVNEDIDWLLEEIAWLNQQLAEARRAIKPAVARDLAADAVALAHEHASRADAAKARAAELHALAAEILGKFCRTSDGHRARAGQVQIAKWEAILGTEALARHPETRR